MPPTERASHDILKLPERSFGGLTPKGSQPSGGTMIKH